MQEIELAAVDSALAKKIQDLVELGNEHSDKPDYTKSLKCYEEAWSLLPKEKSKWDLAQWIAMSIFQDFMAQKAYEDAKKWAQISYDSRPSDIDFASLIDLGWVSLEKGEFEESYEWLSKAFEIEGKSAFLDYPAHIFKFYRERKKSQN